MAKIPEAISFSSFKEKVVDKEGIVLLGAGGDLSQWIEGVTKILHDEFCINTNDPDFAFPEKYKLETTGGRTDLAMVFDGSFIDLGKMAMWRLRFGDCSWISDYIVNYACHH